VPYQPSPLNDTKKSSTPAPMPAPAPAPTPPNSVHINLLDESPANGATSEAAQPSPFAMEAVPTTAVGMTVEEKSHGGPIEPQNERTPSIINLKQES